MDQNVATITKQADGSILFTSEAALTAAFEEVANKTAAKIKAELPAEITRLGIHPVMDANDPKALAIVPEGEGKRARYQRVKKALVEIKGGRLAVEHAPKEIKMMRYIREGLIGKNNEIVKALSEGSATDGGNLVPVEFGTDLLVAIEQYTISPDCDNYDMTTNELDLRTVTTKPIVYQVDELVAPTEAGTKFGKPQLVAKAFAGLQVMSKELFYDNNVGLYQKLVTLFGERFGGRRSAEILGNVLSEIMVACGQSLTYAGVLAAATTTTKKTLLTAGASFKNLQYQDLVNCKNSLSPGQLAGGGKWYMHRTIFSLIEQMVDKNNRPIVLNPWDPAARTLFGYPVVLDEQAVDISLDASGLGFIVFGNLEWVAFGTRQEITATVVTEGTVASKNLAETRGIGLIMDERWGVYDTIPANIAGIYTN